MPCPHCGFDPLMYRIDCEKTVTRVKDRLQYLKSTGQYMFKAKNPLANLPMVQAVDSFEKARRAVRGELGTNLIVRPPNAAILTRKDNERQEQL